MNVATSRARAIIDAARTAEPTASDRERIRTALIAKLGVAAFPSTAKAPLLQAPAAAAQGLAGAKLVTALALAGALGFGAGHLSGRPISAPPAARHGVAVETLRHAQLANLPEPAKAVEAPEAHLQETKSEVAETHPSKAPLSHGKLGRPHAPKAPEPPAAIALRPDPTPAGTDSAAATKANSLLEETAMLKDAQAALAVGDANGALTKLDELGGRHPNGLLREERLAARVMALCAAGRTGDARHEADGFLAEHPGSIQAKRVRSSCAFASSP